MFLDALVTFSNAQVLTSAATTALVSSTTYDIASVGVGSATNMISGINGTTGAAVVIGADMGAGDGFAIPQVFWNVTTAFAGGTGTLQVKLQAAPDSGANVPGSWSDLYTSQLFTVADLTAGAANQFQIPPVPSDFGEANPRFYRLLYAIATATFSAGAVSANIVLNPTQAARIGTYPSNYVS